MPIPSRGKKRKVEAVWSKLIVSLAPLCALSVTRETGATAICKIRIAQDRSKMVLNNFWLVPLYVRLQSHSLIFYHHHHRQRHYRKRIVNGKQAGVDFRLFLPFLLAQHQQMMLDVQHALTF